MTWNDDETDRWLRRAVAKREAELAGRPWREEEWERLEREREGVEELGA